MAEYIKCRNCESPDCKGCNLKRLETMLENGKFDCMMNENRCINTSADVEPVQEWISVDDRLPEDDLPKDTKKKMIRCLVYTNKGTIKPCVRQRWEVNGKLVPWQWNKDLFANPTHWMYYPLPPKGE